MIADSRAKSLQPEQIRELDASNLEPPKKRQRTSLILQLPLPQSQQARQDTIEHEVTSIKKALDSDEQNQSVTITDARQISEEDEEIELGRSGDDTDYSRAKRHKHHVIEPDDSKNWVLLEIETELDLKNTESFRLKHPINTKKYYDAVNVLAPALRTHISAGLRGFEYQKWSVKLLSGKEIDPNLMFLNKAEGEAKVVRSQEYLMFCVIPKLKERLRHAFQCKFNHGCHMIFFNYALLTNHLNKHEDYLAQTGLTRLPLSCYRQKKFKRKDHYAGLEKFPKSRCHVCKKELATTENLMRHMKKQHLQTAEVGA